MGRPLTQAATYKHLMLRLPLPILEACRAGAERERRSLNAQILWVLEEWLQDTAERKDTAFSAPAR